MKASKLNNYLIAYNKFRMVSFDRNRILCEISQSFNEHDLREQQKTGRTPVVATQSGSFYVIFDRR